MTTATQTIRMGPDELVLLSVDEIRPDPMNPNVEDLGTFNELVEALRRNKESGGAVVTENVVVVPIYGEPEGEGGPRPILYYILVSGEHRWKAAKLVGETHVPALIKHDWDEDARRVELVKHNVLKGKLDPRKFTELWTVLEKKYGADALKKMMGLASREGELKRLLKQVTQGLPGPMREELQKRADKIRRVEDLASVVQSIFAKHGSTVDVHYVAWAFGGQTHLLVQADKATFGPVMVLAEVCRDKGIPLDVVLARKAACTCSDCSEPFMTQEAQGD